MILRDPLYSLDDITIIPAPISNIRSRSECNPYKLSIENKSGYLPVIAAPMDSVVDDTCYKEYHNNKISCVIPRTVSIEKRLELCNEVFCAFGFKEIEEYFIDNNFESNKFYVLIDVANGHMRYQLDLGKNLKEKYGDKISLMGGNIANFYSIEYYMLSGFDYVRCGIGGGSGCLTSVHTSIHCPMASLIDDLYLYREKIFDRTKHVKTQIIADGGIKTYSDVIKCLALGADYVMMGYTFSKAIDSAGEFYDNLGNLLSREQAKLLFSNNNSIFKDYHGMSTKKIQAKILGVELEKERHNLKTSEGKFELTKIEYDLKGWTDNLESYIRSTLSYTNCRDINYFNSDYGLCTEVMSESSQRKLLK